MLSWNFEQSMSSRIVWNCATEISDPTHGRTSAKAVSRLVARYR